MDFLSLGKNMLTPFLPKLCCFFCILYFHAGWNNSIYTNDIWYIVLCRVIIEIFNFWFVNKSKFQFNSNGMEVIHIFIFWLLTILIIFGDIELKPEKNKPYKNSHCVFISLILLWMIFPSYLYLKLVTLSIYSTLYVSRKHT